jgi:transposase
VLRFRLMVKRGPWLRPQDQKEKRSMDHFAGLDVSVKETSICMLDDTGRIMKEVRWRASLKPSQWLFSGLAEAGLPVVCVETRHIRAALKARINKTDRNDARGIAHAVLRR